MKKNNIPNRSICVFLSTNDTLTYWSAVIKPRLQAYRVLLYL